MNIKSGTTLIDQIRHRVRSSGLTQHELARITGMDQANVARFLCPPPGKTYTIDTAQRFIDAMGGADLKWRRRARPPS